MAAKGQNDYIPKCQVQKYFRKNDMIEFLAEGGFPEKTNLDTKIGFLGISSVPKNLLIHWYDVGFSFFLEYLSPGSSAEIKRTPSRFRCVVTFKLWLTSDKSIFQTFQTVVMTGNRRFELA